MFKRILNWLKKDCELTKVYVVSANPYVYAQEMKDYFLDHDTQGKRYFFVRNSQDLQDLSNCTVLFMSSARSHPKYNEILQCLPGNNVTVRHT
jgi:hypothetical protein